MQPCESFLARMKSVCKVKGSQDLMQWVPHLEYKKVIDKY